jgi:hypothetical protein
MNAFHKDKFLFIYFSDSSHGVDHEMREPRHGDASHRLKNDGKQEAIGKPHRKHIFAMKQRVDYEAHA